MGWTIRIQSGCQSRREHPLPTAKRRHDYVPIRSPRRRPWAFGLAHAWSASTARLGRRCHTIHVWSACVAHAGLPRTHAATPDRSRAWIERPGTRQAPRAASRVLRSAVCDARRVGRRSSNAHQDSRRRDGRPADLQGCTGDGHATTDNGRSGMALSKKAYVRQVWGTFLDTIDKRVHQGIEQIRWFMSEFGHSGGCIEWHSMGNGGVFGYCVLELHTEDLVYY